MNDAARQVARGDIKGALSQYALADRLHLAPDQRAATLELIKHWERLPKREQNGKTLMVTGSKRDARVLNELAHQSRLRSGELGRLMWQRIDGCWVRNGDRLLFRIGSKALGFRSGDLGTIERIGLSGITVRLDRPTKLLAWNRTTRVHVPKSLYRGLSMGYAVTATDAQGMTSDRVLALPRAGGDDAQGIFIQLSAGRNETRVFTTPRTVGEDVESIERAARLRPQTELQTVPEIHADEPQQHQRKGLRL